MREKHKIYNMRAYTFMRMLEKEQISNKISSWQRENFNLTEQDSRNMTLSYIHIHTYVVSHQHESASILFVVECELILFQ